MDIIKVLPVNLERRENNKKKELVWTAFNPQLVSAL